MISRQPAPIIKRPLLDKKLVEYQIEEQRLLNLSGPYTGGTLQPHQRCYFGPNSRLKGRRLVGVTVLAPENINWIINDVTVLNFGQIDGISLTLVDRRKEEIIKDFPIRDLSKIQTLGKTRIFDLEVDLESSYVTTNNPNAAFGTLGILFNFYTINPDTYER